MVHIGRAMQGDHKVFLRNQLVKRTSLRFGEARLLREQRIDHRIAHKVNPVFRYACITQVGVGDFGGGKKVIRDLVGHHAVDFLGHAQVSRPDARFHMRYFDL